MERTVRSYSSNEVVLQAIMCFGILQKIAAHKGTNVLSAFYDLHSQNSQKSLLEITCMTKRPYDHYSSFKDEQKNNSQ